MTIPKDILLNDTQRELLLNASRCEDGVMSRPAGMKAAMARKVAADLTEKKLAREVRAKAGAPVWRRDSETGRGIALMMTKQARALLEDQDRQTAPALTASEIAMRQEESASPQSGAADKSVDPRSPARNAEACNDCGAKTVEPTPPPIATPRSGTKLAELIALLNRTSGAGIEELIAATGWLPHTVRAALTSLRKRGYDVRRERGAKGSVYSIATMPTPALAA